jgi:hypothetical protein
LANVEAQAAASEDLDSDAHSNTPAQEYYNCLNKARELLLACMEKVPKEEVSTVFQLICAYVK